MGTREDILGRIRTSRSELDRLVLSLQPDDFAREAVPGWTVKDLLAHLTAWERSVLGLLDGADRGVAMGLEPGMFGRLDEDALNQALFEANRAHSVESVLRDYHATYDELCRRLESMDDAALERSYSHYQPNDPPENLAPVTGWIEGNTWEHYEEHLPALRGALARG